MSQNKPAGPAAARRPSHTSSLFSPIVDIAPLVPIQDQHYARHGIAFPHHVRRSTINKYHIYAALPKLTII